jgi:hypothetical protein
MAGDLRGPLLQWWALCAARETRTPINEIESLQRASTYDWSKVSPDIFGTLFEESLAQVERHAFGAYFTSPVDIMKIVGPTIVDPWRRQIDSGELSETLMHSASHAQLSRLGPGLRKRNFCTSLTES